MIIPTGILFHPNLNPKYNLIPNSKTFTSKSLALRFMIGSQFCHIKRTPSSPHRLTPLQTLNLNLISLSLRLIRYTESIITNLVDIVGDNRHGNGNGKDTHLLLIAFIMCRCQSYPMQPQLQGCTCKVHTLLPGSKVRKASPEPEDHLAVQFRSLRWTPCRGKHLYSSPARENKQSKTHTHKIRITCLVVLI